ncbi:hypothetical protein, partial [Cryobacterium sp. TMT4-10]|uniref:hypothetical protein n=1 Tax=Cryobacterium sp. TMT4-10 TaxID=1259256 RepID=UPI001A7E0616
PVITAFVKGNSFPALYNTIRDDPGALSKVDREGRAYLEKFTSYADFAASPTTQLTPGADTRYQWATSDATTLAAFKLCHKQSEWQWTQTQSSATGTPNQAIVNISAEQMGPGTHDLFVVGVSYPDDQACSVTWPDSGSWSGYGCPPEFTVDEMTVAVGYSASTGSVLPGPSLDKGSAYDASVFSDLPLTAGDGTRESAANLPSVGPVLITIALTLIFAILIALPSALLESTFESNESRIGDFLRKFLPGRRRPAPRVAAATRDKNSESDA